MKEKILLEHIELNSKVMVKKPVIKAIRLSVEFILNLFSNGVTGEKYEGLTKEDILAYFLFASCFFSETEFMPLEKEAA